MPVKLATAASVFTAALAVTGLASAGGVVFDQIGDNGGADLDGGSYASQYFEPDVSGFDIGALDDFTLESGTTIISIEAVIFGDTGYGGLGDIEGYQINIYSDPWMAALSLVGDVHSSNHATFDSTINIGKLLDIVQFDTNIILPEGTFYVAVIPTMSFFRHGQTRIASSFLGDGDFWQANPNGAFGFPNNLLEGVGNLAYRLTVPSPGALALLAMGAVGVRRNRKRAMIFSFDTSVIVRSLSAA